MWYLIPCDFFVVHTTHENRRIRVTVSKDFVVIVLDFCQIRSSEDLFDHD